MSWSHVVPPPLVLRARLEVLAAALALLAGLLTSGLAPLAAIAVSILVLVATLAVGCRLTAPYPAPVTRASVIVVVVVVILQLVTAGYDAQKAAAVVLVTALSVVGVARRAFPIPLGIHQVREANA